jgi:hypothetical protein
MTKKIDWQAVILVLLCTTYVAAMSLLIGDLIRG